jgi:hypothetical protein
MASSWSRERPCDDMRNTTIEENDGGYDDNEYGGVVDYGMYPQSTAAAAQEVAACACGRRRRRRLCFFCRCCGSNFDSPSYSY